MKKIEINRKKEKRLFKIIFLVPAILLIFLSIMIIASDNSSYESVFKTIFASFAIISIWFTISFVLTNIIALIFYREKIIDEIKKYVESKIIIENK